MVPLALTVVLLQGPPRADALTLAEDGQARVTIVLPAEPIPAEQTAATELASYLGKITGAEFAISSADATDGRARLLVGPSEVARDALGDTLLGGLGPEEFVIRSAGEDLLLVGGRPRGTLYAVYSFLDQDLGCRWMTWYGDESIPRHETLAVQGIDRREAPAMAARDIVTHTNSNSDRELMKQFLVRNRCQGPDLRFTGDVTAYGGTSHRYALNGLWLAHTLFGWMPPDEHFETHPEYYSLAGDRRVRTRQLCFTNPGLREALTDAVLERIGRQDPSATYSLSAMDWTGPFCDCADCRALVEREETPGAPLFDYLAELGPLVAERFPQAYISTLAYRREQSEAPPRTIKLPDNVIIIFAPIDNNFAAPMKHPSNAEALRNLQNWPQATNHLWVWYYPNTYGPALPTGNLHRLAEDFRLLKQVGVEGYFVEHDAPGVYDSRRLADLQTWLITRLMWDPDRDLDELIEDYTDRHYGPAAPTVRQYITALEAATAAAETPMSWNASTGQHGFLTPELLVQCQQLMDAAETAVADDEVRLLRVRQARMSLDLAGVLLWTGLAVTGDVPFAQEQIVARYRDTYTQSINARALPERREALIGAMEEALKWHLIKTPAKPLPPPLDAVPAERIRQFTPETFKLFGDVPTLVEDESAAASIAATMAPSLTKPAYAPADLPADALNFGFYDATTKRQQHAYAGVGEPIETGEYRLFPVGRTALSTECYVWLDWSWHIQLHDVAGLYAPDDPDKQWDIYVSIRFEGPAYDPASQATENRFYVDRIVLVEAD